MIILSRVRRAVGHREFKEPAAPSQPCRRGAGRFGGRPEVGDTLPTTATLPRAAGAERHVMEKHFPKKMTPPPTKDWCFRLTHTLCHKQGHL